MLNLKESLESFSLSEDTRRKILNEDHPFGNQGTPFIPSEFKEIAQIALAGHFLVTPIGCGIAGFEAEDIAPLFESAKEIKNISLPESFWEVIE